jgi:hypothetical protein
MITTAELAELQAIDESTMTATGVVSRPTNSSDTMGGQTQNYATVHSGPCRLRRMGTRPSDGVAAERGQVATDWLVFWPVGTDVRTTDRIVIAGRTFEVVKALAGTWQTSLRVQVVEVG